MKPVDFAHGLRGLRSDRLVVGGVEYMRRYYLPCGGRYHHILRSDPGHDLHDHPWDYRSTLLSGSYLELTSSGESRFVAGDTLTRDAEHLHRLVVDGPVWTLFVPGPVRRHWGFQTAGGWVYHRRYTATDRQPEVAGRW